MAGEQKNVLINIPAVLCKMCFVKLQKQIVNKCASVCREPCRKGNLWEEAE